MPKKITVSVIGATGYTGLELIRILAAHPRVEFAGLVSGTHAGESLADIWPHLKKICDGPLSDMDMASVAKSDVVFFALPHGEAQKVVGPLIGKTKIIDLSADFRIHNISGYEKYYGKHLCPEYVKSFVYGVPELNCEEMKKASLVANPGCFAIATELALAPIAQAIAHVAISAVTGSSGSGKTPKDGTHHPVRSHNMASYQIGTHRHIPEILQTLDIEHGQLSFVPTSGPFVRGIHVTAFVDLKNSKVGNKHILDVYRSFYKDAPFVRVKKSIQLADVIASNYCDITVYEKNGKLIIQSAIDNLVKGASGNAVQNMNLMCGFDQTEGIGLLSPVFP